MKIRTILLALSMMSLNAHAQYYDYDVNKDGEVNVTDVTFIINKILGKENPIRMRPITFSASQKPLVGPDDPASNRRKTPETTIQTLEEFFVNCTYPDDGMNLVSSPEMRTYWQSDQGKWLIGNKKNPGHGYWPIIPDNVVLKFYAYANVNNAVIKQRLEQNVDDNYMFFCDGYGNNSDDVSKPYIHFIMDEGSATTRDLLVAQQSNSWNGTGKTGQVFFLFDHACAATKFFLVKSSTLSKYDVEVFEVKLYNVVAEGDYFFNTGWDLQRYINSTYGIHKTMYTLWDSSQESIEVKDCPNPVTDSNGKQREDISKMKQLTSSTSPDNDYFFFIPYHYTESDNAYIEIVCKITPKDGTSGGSFGGSEGAIARLPFKTESLQEGIWNPIVIKMGLGLKDENGNYIFDAYGNINPSQQ